MELMKFTAVHVNSRILKRVHGRNKAISIFDLMLHKLCSFSHLKVTVLVILYNLYNALKIVLHPI